MRARVYGLIGLLLSLPAASAGAQEPVSGMRLPCDTVTVGGAIRGVVLNDSTGGPIVGRGRIGVSQRGEVWCVARTDSAGRFEIGMLPPGPYQVLVSGYHPDYRRPPSMPVEVREDSTTELVVRLQPWSLLGDCRRRAGCAALLDSRSERVESLDDAERLEEAVLRTSIALAGWTGTAEWIPCADVSSERVRRALRERVPTLAPDSECEMSGSIDGSGLVHRPSGAPGWRFEIGRMAWSGADVQIDSSSYNGPRGATVWSCRFRPVGDEWIAERCVVVLRS